MSKVGVIGSIITVFVVVVMIGILGMLGGCNYYPTDSFEVPNRASPHNRFVYTGQEYYISGNFSSFKVVKDTNTGVLYLHDTSPRGGGLTPFLDSDGKPLLENITTQSSVDVGKR
jgi:hypothetical protein